jgi:DNA modification methylase
MSTSVIYLGDVRQGLKKMPDKSVQCCVTSPPYWGLRDYGTANWEGGDADCDHLGKPMGTKANINRNCGTGVDKKNAEAREFFKHQCGKCGAVRVDDQIGLEATPQEFVAALVEVFDEVWRVLKDDGVLWLNLGDSYVGYKGDNYQTNKESSKLQSKSEVPSSHKIGTPQTSGLKTKDLVGIPWRVAFALQDAGWYLRQDIIWAKPNPMPESVRDRCTKSHEYIFMLTKQPRYFFNNEAIQEAAIHSQDRRAGQGRLTYEGKRQGESGTGQEAFVAIKDTRNKRDVWNVPSKPFKGAHFAVMPEAIVEPCVLATSNVGDTVLDPFTGSGTVALVANNHQRNFVGCELNPEYADIALNRISDGKLFVEAEIIEI